MWGILHSEHAPDSSGGDQIDGHHHSQGNHDDDGKPGYTVEDGTVDVISHEAAVIDEFEHEDEDEGEYGTVNYLGDEHD